MRCAMQSDPASVARRSYQAYGDKDRAALETLLAANFHFTSPLDNRLDRTTYFERCWPNSAAITGFKFIHIVPGGERVFVTYGAEEDGSAIPQHRDRHRPRRLTADTKRPNG